MIVRHSKLTSIKKEKGCAKNDAALSYMNEVK